MRMVRLLMAAVLGLLGLVIVAPPASAATQAVMIENYAYSPSTLTVKVGDTVTWTNHDQAPHDVTTTSAPVAIKSPMLSTGQSFTYTFTMAGSYSYYCSIHPDMRAQVVVQPAAVAPAPPVTTAPKTTTSLKPATTSRPAASTSQAAGQAPVSSMSMPPGTEAAAPASSVAPVETQPAVAAGVTPTSTTTLDPMLIVAGVAAGVAVLCLLILGSRRET